MRDEYDFSKGKRNPYPAKFKKRISINLDKQVIDYFKVLAAHEGIGYQVLINQFLRHCSTTQMHPKTSWGKAK